ARKDDPANPVNQPAMPSFDAENSPAPDSLGEVARRYRREKAAREAEDAAKSLSPSLFPMDLTRPALAAPVEPSAPLAPPKLVPFQNSKPVVHVAPSSKRDPFSPPMASPSLRNARPDLSSNLPGPSKPSLPLANVAPNAPATRVGTPGVAPSLGVSPAGAPAPVQPAERRAPQRPLIAPRLSTNAPTMPKSHTGPASAPNLVHPVSPSSAPSFSSQAKPMAPQAVPHTDITGPILPKSRLASAPAPRLQVRGAQNAVPPSLASHGHLAIPAMNPVVESAPAKAIAHTSNVAPALPKSHLSSANAPKLKVSNDHNVVPAIEVAPPAAPLAHSEAQPPVAAAPPIVRTAAFAPFLPKSHRVVAAEPALLEPALGKLMPTPLAPDAMPVPPALVAHTEIVAPVLPSSNISPAPTPNLLPSSATGAVPSSFAPSATPVAPLLSKSNSKKTETLLVQFGDSLWKLARRRFGKGSRWTEFLASNPAIVDPNLLQPGAVLVVPNTELHPRVQPPNTITVQTGDSLWKLAAYYLGKGSAWTCIAGANPQLQNVNLLQPSQVLTLPTSCSK
ncbi:MAG TPA: LysM peptidoglycan-binding domain-containing protein, partial [Candidatus Acidoferrum sp.]